MLTGKQIIEIKSALDGNLAGLPLVFQALGDPGRFNIFRLLTERPDVCVSDVARIFNITVSAASQQLRVLERLGLAVKTRMGQMVCYEINHANPTVGQLVKLLKESNK